MTEISVVQNQTLEQLIGEVSQLKNAIQVTLSDLKGASKAYLSINEVVEITGLSRSSINRYRDEIGFTNSGGCIRFKRKDVEAFMEENYFKAPR